MTLPTDVRVTGVSLYYLPIENRVPLKFGTQVVTTVTCARACVEIEDRRGRRDSGWGETPLSVQWAWPSNAPYEPRLERMQKLCSLLAAAWASRDDMGHPIEIGHRFVVERLPELLGEANRGIGPDDEPMPWLAALIASSPFDQALHDAYGLLHDIPTYFTYGRDWLNADLAAYLQPASGSEVTFHDRYPEEFLVLDPPRLLPAWHLVGGLDPLEEDDLTGAEPADGYPVLLGDWIRRDGLRCLKVKLRGIDSAWDYERMVRVGRIAISQDVDWLSADFNCTVTDPAYVTEILDRLQRHEPRIYGMLLYVEQPFPYDLEAYPLDVHAVSARKPLFMDESAHDWRLVQLGRSRGWSGVALKTCKTQSEALLTLCWARAHGMTLMVQDLTNPMLAQIPHLLLAAHASTIMGVETNGMQFYPDASRPEAVIHPGLYRRRNGSVDLSSIGGPGFGYRVNEIKRALPPPAARCR